MAWIGTSFYFVLLDQSLRPPKDAADADAGVGGELWEVHGGGFYRVQKYVVAPARLPDHLAWFKWEAYTTWLSGFALMLVLYYLEASSALVKPGDDLDPGSPSRSRSRSSSSPGSSTTSLNRLVSDARVLWPVLFVLVALAAWALAGALQPAGGMAPGRRDDRDGDGGERLLRHHPRPLGADPCEGGGPRARPRPGLQAKQRSVHNNYLTLPVLLTMLAGHFPFAYGADHAWLVLVALMAIGAWARLFFNLRHTGGRTGGCRSPARRRSSRSPSLVERSDDDRGRSPPQRPTSRGARRSSPRQAAPPATRSRTPARRARSARASTRRSLPRTRDRPRDERARARCRLRREASRRRRSPRSPRTSWRAARGRIAADAPDHRRRVRVHCTARGGRDAPPRSPRSGGSSRSSRGSSTSAGRARRAGSRSATSTSASGRRTRRATRTRARSSSTRAVSPRPRSCSRTATSTSPRRPASSRGTTSPRSSRATSTCATSARSSSGRARRRSSSARSDPRTTGGQLDASRSSASVRTSTRQRDVVRRGQLVGRVAHSAVQRTHEQHRRRHPGTREHARIVPGARARLDDG